MRILVVDDSKAMRLIIKRVLGHTMYRDAVIDESADGLQALAAIVADPPDLVLSDWNMPEMSGLELLRSLREASVDVPFGFVTSESTADMRELAIAEGALFLIAKPFTADTFAASLSGVLVA